MDKKFYKSQDNRTWYGFEPEDKTGLIEITEEEFNNHVAELEAIVEAKRNANRP